MHFVLHSVVHEIIRMVEITVFFDIAAGTVEQETSSASDVNISRHIYTENLQQAQASKLRVQEEWQKVARQMCDKIYNFIYNYSIFVCLYSFYSVNLNYKIYGGPI